MEQDQKSFLVRYKELFYLALILGLNIAAFKYSEWKIQDWRYSFTGDEYGFLNVASDYVSGVRKIDPFQIVLFGHQFGFSLLYHTIFMYFLSPENYAYRFANLSLIPAASLISYVAIRRILTAETALFSVLLFCTSCYFHNFFLIPYNNQFSLVYLTIIFAAYAYCFTEKKRNSLKFLMTGIITGMAFYVYLGQVLGVICVPLVLACCYVQYKTHEFPVALRNILTLIITGFVVALPGATNEIFRISVLEKSVFKAEYTDIKFFYNNIYDAITLKLFTDPHCSHYFCTPYVDYITAGLALAGILVLLATRFKYGAFFLFMGLLVGSLIGGLSPYPYVSNTRAFLLLPLTYFFAGIALAFVNNLKFIRLLKLNYLLIPAAFVMIIRANIQRDAVFFNNPNINMHYNSVVLKYIAERYQSGSPASNVTVVMNRASCPAINAIDIYNETMPYLAKIYGYGNITYTEVETFDQVAPGAEKLVIDACEMLKVSHAVP